MAIFAGKRWKLASLAVLGLAGAISFSYAFVGIYNGIQVQDQLDCPYDGPIPGDIAISINGQVFNGTTKGSGKFEATFVSPETVPTHEVRLKAVSISATSTFPGLGTVTTTLDAANPTLDAKVEGLVPGQDFPAKVRIPFHAIATTDAGVRYTSQNPVVFKTDNATSFNKFVNEPFTLDGPVVFKNSQGGSFTLIRLNSKFN